MRNFVFKTLWFLLPILALNILTFIFYSRDGNSDLLRLGYIINLFPNYQNIFYKEYKNKIYYTSVSEKPKNRKFKILTIGDSFSEQFGYGFKNYLAQYNGNSILHIDRFLSGNPIQTIYNLLKGDFFEQYNFEYVIIQNVENELIDRIENIDTNKIITSDKLIDLVNVNMEPKRTHISYEFLSNSTIKLLYYTFQYYSKNTFLFDDAVYKTKISRNLFSVDNNELLFYSDDVVKTKINNIYENVYKLNNVFNDLNNLLKKKGVKLIVLPSPDKYDIYYDYIVDKKGFPKPIFFEQLNKMHKDYIYVDSKKILFSALNQTKDIYYYADTHWSPWASQLIAAEIENQIKIYENKVHSDNKGYTDRTQ